MTPGPLMTRQQEAHGGLDTRQWGRLKVGLVWLSDSLTYIGPSISHAVGCTHLKSQLGRLNPADM